MAMNPPPRPMPGPTRAPSPPGVNGAPPPGGPVPGGPLGGPPAPGGEQLSPDEVAEIRGLLAEIRRIRQMVAEQGPPPGAGQPPEGLGAPAPGAVPAPPPGPLGRAQRPSDLGPGL
jgi:hypothetical protein